MKSQNGLKPFQSQHLDISTVPGCSKPWAMRDLPPAGWDAEGREILGKEEALVFPTPLSLPIFTLAASPLSDSSGRKAKLTIFKIFPKSLDVPTKKNPQPNPTIQTNPQPFQLNSFINLGARTGEDLPNYLLPLK